MKIAVFGAGAIGGCVGARLALAGIDVTLVARGRVLRAIEEHGLRLRDASGERMVRPRTVADPATLGPHAVLIVCTKAYGLAPALPQLRGLIGPATTIVPLQNGLPWWYFHRAGGPFDGEAIAAVDADGALLRELPPAQVVGCVVYLAASVASPGVIDLTSPGRFVLGEPDGADTSRLHAIADVMRAAGFDVGTTDRIRDAIWTKLWGNLPLNSISALTLAGVRTMADDPRVHRVVARMMSEMRDVAAALGVRLDMDIEERIALAAKLGAFRTSMLQDLEGGRPLEIDALVGAVTEIARRVEIPTPTIDVVESLLRLRAAAMPREALNGGR